MLRLPMIWLGKLFERFKMPALVTPFRFYDGDKGQVIEIKTSPFYTKLIVGDKEFFFNRESGKYDGFGAMEKDLSELATTGDCTPDYIQQ